MTYQIEDMLDDALDALEMMCFQYMSYNEAKENYISHAFMSAGEYACEVLCRIRPNRWRETGDGMEYIG